jgi:membrane associated rhomboid family serine protease
MSISSELKYSFKHGSVVTRLIYTNLAVFLLVRITSVFLHLFKIDNNILSWLALPSDTSIFITRPWTLFTYMFLHVEFLHIIFNLLWLYWFGKLFLIYFEEKKLLSLYLIGGIVGGLLYMLAYNLFPAFNNVVSLGFLHGASASIIAILIALAVYAPNLELNLLLISSIFGPIKIIWIAIISVTIYFLSIIGTNPGGNIAHLGGALWGFIYVSQLKKGKDLTRKFNDFIGNASQWFKSSSKLKVSHRANTKKMSDWEYNRKKQSEQEEINVVLDKISRSGYDSLTKAEKDLLFKMGGRKDKYN